MGFVRIKLKLSGWVDSFTIILLLLLLHFLYLTFIFTVDCLYTTVISIHTSIINKTIILNVIVMILTYWSCSISIIRLPALARLVSFYLGSVLSFAHLVLVNNAQDATLIGICSKSFVGTSEVRLYILSNKLRCRYQSYSPLLLIHSKC